MAGSGSLWATPWRVGHVKEVYRPTKLNEAERATLNEIVTRLNGSSRKVRLAQVLLKADGPAWTDAEIAETYG